MVPWHEDLAYSLRRYHVDRFLERELARLAPSTRVLDLGGHRERRRGRLDLDALPLARTSANIAITRRPHVLADAARLPFAAGSFPAILLSEVLEHVPDPWQVLVECARVLAPGGRLIATIPFMFPVHADPHDHGRYTAQALRAHLTAAGFAVDAVEPQGRFFAVLSDMLRAWAAEGLPGMHPLTRLRRRTLAALARWSRVQAIAWDESPAVLENAVLSGYTTGYGIVATRP